MNVARAQEIGALQEFEEEEEEEERRKTSLEDKSFGIRAWGIRGLCNLTDNKWPVRDCQSSANNNLEDISLGDRS